MPISIQLTATAYHEESNPGGLAGDAQSDDCQGGGKDGGDSSGSGSGRGRV